MHTVELLAEAITLAESLGYGVRQEWLGGGPGGVCEIAGKPWLFIDLALNPMEQLDQVTEALKRDPQIHSAPMPTVLRIALGLKMAA